MALAVLIFGEGFGWNKKYMLTQLTQGIYKIFFCENVLIKLCIGVLEHLCTT